MATGPLAHSMASEVTLIAFTQMLEDDKPDIGINLRRLLPSLVVGQEEVGACRGQKSEEMKKHERKEKDINKNIQIQKRKTSLLSLIFFPVRIRPRVQWPLPRG